MSNLGNLSRIKIERRMVVLPGMYQTAVPTKSWEPCVKFQINFFGAEDRDRWRALERAVMSNEPSGSIKCGEFLD